MAFEALTALSLVKKVTTAVLREVFVNCVSIPPSLNLLFSRLLFLDISSTYLSLCYAKISIKHGILSGVQATSKTRYFVMCTSNFKKTVFCQVYKQLQKHGILSGVQATSKTRYFVRCTSNFKNTVFCQVYKQLQKHGILSGVQATSKTRYFVRCTSNFKNTVFCQVYKQLQKHGILSGVQAASKTRYFVRCTSNFKNTVFCQVYKQLQKHGILSGVQATSKTRYFVRCTSNFNLLHLSGTGSISTLLFLCPFFTPYDLLTDTHFTSGLLPMLPHQPNLFWTWILAYIY